MTSAYCLITEHSSDHDTYNSNGDKEKNEAWRWNINNFGDTQESACLYCLSSSPLSSAITASDTTEDTVSAVVDSIKATTTGRLVRVIEIIPWDARRYMLKNAGEVAAIRLGRTCRAMRVLVRNDAGLWQLFYAQSFLRDAQRVEHEFLEWCSEERADYYKSTTDDLMGHERNESSCNGYELRNGAFANAHARWKHANYLTDTPIAVNKVAEERSMDWYAAYRRRAATEANWRAGRYVRHNIFPPAVDVRTAALLHSRGMITVPHMIAGSAAGLLLLQGDRLYCVHQPCSQDASFYKLEELDLEAETAGILQVRAAHMSGNWIVVELHDPQYPEAGGSISAWRIGNRQASCAVELEESSERIQEVRGRWALLTRRQQGATLFTVVDLELGLRSIGELRVHCRSAEILHVDNEKVHLLVNEHIEGQRDDEENDTSANLSANSTLAQDVTLSYLNETTANTGNTSLLPIATGTIQEPVISSTSSSTSTSTSTSTTNSTITCAIYCLALESLPTLVTSVKIPSPPRLLCRSLRIRVIDARRILLEYIESGTFDVRVVVHRLNVSLTSDNLPISQLTSYDDDANHAIVLISWYRRRPVVIRDCTAIWTKMNAHDAAAGYLISPSLGRSGLLFHSEYFEGDATLMDMSTWQPQCDLGYWPPAAGPNLVTPTFIARMKEGDGGLEIWNFAAW
ncbi:hypothetical protein BDF22DRAFT_742549 [Syncephalis plumigaleata]|nr:hypothetical protein BDF22DRAFT_742549 [Syncephalis plumigaleata]